MKAIVRDRRPKRPTPSFRGSLREFLTPELWKQAQMHRRAGRRSSRWRTQPLVLMVLFMTWCCGDSQPERFETAKAFCEAFLPKRRRVGKTVQGYQKALSKLPVGVLRGVASHVRKSLACRLASRWSDKGWIAIGCDGSRVECPRTTELEQRLGRAGKEGSAPSIWVTTLVLLRQGLPWAWRLGKGIASERWHLQQLLPCLPKRALLVADAGYVGYELARHMIESQVSFLIRMSSIVTLYTMKDVRLKRFREGQVYYWPSKAQETGGSPLLLRLIRLRAKKKKHDVWLLTSVLEEKHLPASTAGNFYRWRWENECLFRTYKRTLAKVKLASRTVRLVHREAEGSMLALQLLLAQGVLAMAPAADGDAEKVCSPRRVLLAIRQEMGSGQQRGQMSFRERLEDAHRERRQRTSGKDKRPWPRRKPHLPPKPPKILTLTKRQKARISRLEMDAA